MSLKEHVRCSRFQIQDDFQSIPIFLFLAGFFLISQSERSSLFSAAVVNLYFFQPHFFQRKVRGKVNSGVLVRTRDAVFLIEHG